VVITWKSGGRENWTVFCNQLAAAVNMSAGGPSLRHSRTPGRYPVGTIEAQEVRITIRPGQSLVIVDRTEPAGWIVR
jgi:hypothetical protein